MLKKHAFGIAALLVAVVALGLAILPTLGTDKAFPWWEKPAPPPRPEKKLFAQTEKGVALQVGNVEVRWPRRAGKKEAVDAELAADQAAAEEQLAAGAAPVPPRPSKPWFAYATLACALVGLTLAPVAWFREKELKLAGPAMGICCLAVTWQYVILGIAAGVTAAVFLLIFAALSS